MCNWTEADPGANPAMSSRPFWQWTLTFNEETKIFSLNFPNLCDNVVKKLFPEVRKCRPLRPADP